MTEVMCLLLYANDHIYQDNNAVYGQTSQHRRCLLAGHIVHNSFLVPAGILQDSSTQLTCCGSSAAGQDVVVTLEALVKQLPPGASTDAAAGNSTAGGAGSIRAACWQAAVKQMQQEIPVLGTQQQV
jgi:hypothetical protein